MHEDMLERFYKKYETIIMLTDFLDLSFVRPIEFCSQHFLGDEIAMLLDKLPDRFDHNKLTLILSDDKISLLNSMILRLVLGGQT